MVKQPTSLRC